MKLQFSFSILFSTLLIISPALAATFYVDNSGSPYVNKANGDFHLTYGSAPINAGVNLTATVSTDREGKSRLTSLPPDLGAYEFTTTPSDTIPPSAPSGLNAQ